MSQYIVKKNKAAIDALIKIGVPAVEPLISSLLYKRAKTRCFVAQILGAIKDKRAVMPLINLFEDWRLEVQLFASSAVSKLGDAAVPDLIKALENKKTNVRIAAVLALGKIDNNAAIAALNRIKKDDPDENVRIYARKMIEKLKR